jgi:hypothetical protein
MRVPISTARGKLFELADLVRKASDDSVVVLEQRGHSEGVALVREARLAYLEARERQMEKQDGPTFTLAGSVTTTTSEAALEQALRDSRLEWDPSPTPASPAPARRAAARRGK